MGTRLNCFLYVAETKRAFSGAVYFIRNLKCFPGKHVQEGTLREVLTRFCGHFKVILWWCIALHYAQREHIITATIMDCTHYE